VGGRHDEAAALGERDRETCGVGHLADQRWRARAPLLEALRHRTRECREDAIRVAALPEPAARAAYLPLIAQHGARRPRAIAKMIAAMTGGEPRFHHSGP
jgi:hypothetical protein